MPTPSAKQTQRDSLPLVVKPAAAAAMLSVSRTRLYELLKAKELQSFKDGASRKVTVASIREYVTRQLGASNTVKAA
jgi:excisionase family DNA binding protein